MQHDAVKAEKAVSHLIDEGGEAVIQGLDLLFLLQFDCMDVWIQVELQRLQEVPVHRQSIDREPLSRPVPKPKI